VAGVVPTLPMEDMAEEAIAAAMVTEAGMVVVMVAGTAVTGTVVVGDMMTTIMVGGMAAIGMVAVGGMTTERCERSDLCIAEGYIPPAIFFSYRSPRETYSA
jgi:hypothetical protein